MKQRRHKCVAVKHRWSNPC